MICFAEASLSGQIGPVLSQVFVYIDIYQWFIFLTFGFDIFFDTLETQLNSELKHVSTWLQINKLSLNVDKSCFIVFKAVQKSYLEVNICINDKRLSRVSQVKFLGTIIDDKLTWKPHIDYKSKKLSKAIAIIIG